MPQSIVTYDSAIAPVLTQTTPEPGNDPPGTDQEADQIVNESWQQHTFARNHTPEVAITRLLNPARKPWQKSAWSIATKVLAAASAVALVAGFSILGAGIPTIAIAATLVLVFTLDLVCTIYHESRLRNGEPSLAGGGNVLKNMGMWCASQCGRSQEEQEYAGNIISITIRSLLYIALPIEGLTTLAISVLIPKILLSLVPALFDLCGGLSQLAASSPPAPHSMDDLLAGLLAYIRDHRNILQQAQSEGYQPLCLQLDEIEATLTRLSTGRSNQAGDKQPGPDADIAYGPEWLYAIYQSGRLPNDKFSPIRIHQA
jgi:hypothetical protein